MLGLNDRAVIITGGASGIGRATTLRVLTAASRVAVVDRDGHPLDVVINNAGISRRSHFLETSSEEWREVMSVNLDGGRVCRPRVA